MTNTTSNNNNQNSPETSFSARFHRIFYRTNKSNTSSEQKPVGSSSTLVSSANSPSTPWYTFKVEDVERDLTTHISRGLSNKEALDRLAKYGPNEFNLSSQNTLLRVIFSNVFNAMNIVLLIAMAVSLGFKDYIEAVVIACVFLINTALGIVQEYSSEQTMNALRKMASPTARLLREGLLDVKPSAQVVRGDILHLRQGDIVPADVRLVDVVNFETDEALLTGESMPVRKMIDALDISQAAAVGDRKNMAYKNSLVAKGRAVGIVVETGLNTEVGKIAKSVASSSSSALSEKAPVQKDMDRLMYYLLAMAILMGFVVIAANRFVINNQILLYATAVGIAMIPEGLPIVITISLAVSVRRLALQKAIVRRTSAILSLGEVSNICSDKTGTLTEGKMTVVCAFIGGKTYQITGPGDRPEGNVIQDDTIVIKHEDALANHTLNMSLLDCTLCSSATVTYDDKDNKWKCVGDPTEIALEIFACKMKYEREKLRTQEYKFLAEMPFDNSIKRMTVIYERLSDGKLVYFVKGGMEAVTSRCVAYHKSENDEVHSVDSEFHDFVRQKTSEFGTLGMRVLALGFRVIDKHDAGDLSFDLTRRDSIETDFTFLGLVGIKDPPRAESAPAVRICHIAGINVHMVTGDYATTAASIAKQIGIIEPHGSPEYVKAAPELDSLTNEQMDALTHFPKVVARCAPETKVKIIDALHRRGKYVAMTGDGVNDAPALRKAHVGFAMGLSGSDVAKQASDIILTDDNFATIVKAVAEGRRIFANIVKLSLHLLSCNVAEVILLIIGLSIRDSVGEAIYPMSPIQILWLNMLTSSPIAIALGMESIEAKDILGEPPRKKGTRVLSKEFVIDALVFGTIAGVLGLANFIISLAVDANYFSNDGPFLTQCNKYNESTFDACRGVFVARAVSFYTLSIIFLIHGFVCRSSRKSVFSGWTFGKRRGRTPSSDTVSQIASSESERSRNMALWIAVLIALLLTIPTAYIPKLNLELLSQDMITWEWALIVASVLLFLASTELYKWLKRVYFPLPISRELDEESAQLLPPNTNEMLGV